MKYFVLVLVFAFAGCIIATCASAQDTVEQAPGIVVTIDYPGALATYVYGINSRGTAVGAYTDFAGITHGFRYSQGKFAIIDYPGADVINTSPGGISDAQVIVGSYYGNIFPQSAFTLVNGTYTTVQYGSVLSGYSGINRTGTITGFYEDSDHIVHGFATFAHKMLVIDYPGATRTFAVGVNSSNHVVGGFRDAANLNHGFIWQSGVFQVLDYPGATYTGGDGIDDAGEIGGFYIDSAGVEHGYLWNQGTFQNFDVPGATATEIDGLGPTGIVVGNYTDANGNVHGFLAK